MHYNTKSHTEQIKRNRQNILRSDMRNACFSSFWLSSPYHSYPFPLSLSLSCFLTTPSYPFHLYFSTCITLFINSTFIQLAYHINTHHIYALSMALLRFVFFFCSSLFIYLSIYLFILRMPGSSEVTPSVMITIPKVNRF